jgi:hypothetical protein
MINQSTLQHSNSYIVCCDLSPPSPSEGTRIVRISRQQGRLRSKKGVTKCNQYNVLLNCVGVNPWPVLYYLVPYAREDHRGTLC